MKIQCDWCKTEIAKPPSHIKKHNFCCRECLAKFRNKKSNPEVYSTLCDYTGQRENMRKINQALNPERMTAAVRTKLRYSKLNSGSGKSYTKVFGRHEHRIVAEQILGRKLRSGEVVHHIDGDKRNNRPENLRVFPSQSKHAEWHQRQQREGKMQNEI